MKVKVLSSGIIPVRHVEGQWLFLLLRIYTYWDFPKGEIHPGEDQWIAALRELYEETNIKTARDLWNKQFIETEPYSKGKVARYYLGEVDDQVIQLLPNPETGIIEHHEYRWLKYEEARKLLGPRLKVVIDWAHEILI